MDLLCGDNKQWIGAVGEIGQEVQNFCLFGETLGFNIYLHWPPLSSAKLTRPEKQLADGLMNLSDRIGVFLKRYASHFL